MTTHPGAGVASVFMAGTNARYVPRTDRGGLFLSSQSAIRSHVSAVCRRDWRAAGSIVCSALVRHSSARCRYSCDRLGGLRHANANASTLTGAKL